MFDLEHPKFIINDGMVVMGRVVAHRDLLKDHRKTIGGGWWHYDKDYKIMYLYGTSVEFGSITEEQAREAWDNSYQIDMKMIFSNEERLDFVLHPEKKNKAFIYVDQQKVGECDSLQLPDINPEHIGMDYAESGKDATVFIETGRRQGKKAMIIGTLGHASLLHSALARLDNEAVDIIPIDQHHQSQDQMYIPIENPYKDIPDFSVFGAEKKKKKPCTYHEYVKKGKEAISSNMYKEIWKCRHCDHPLK
jgi:hypothetical protein